MTQDRRKDDKLPEGPLVFTDRNLTAAGLAHLEAERAAACLVHAGGDVWVGVGTKGALRGLLSDDTASQSQAVPSELASLDRETISELAERNDLLSIQDNGRVNFDNLMAFAEDVRALPHSAAHSQEVLVANQSKPLSDERIFQLYHSTSRVLDFARAVESEALTLLKLDDVEQYRQQMAGISAAAFGHWKEGDSIHPEYDTPALRDVAKLYAKYDRLFSHSAATGKVPEGWVSVLDAAPVQGEGVLVTDGTTVTAARWFSTGWATHGFDNDEVTYLPEGRITHWKPLAASPAAPLAGKADDKLELSDPWVTAVRKADHLCPSELSSPDRWRWKAAFMRDQLSASLAAAVPAEEASAEPSRASRIEWSLRQIIEADDDQALTQDLIEAGRAALKLVPAEPAPILASAEKVETDMAGRLRRIVTNIGDGPIAVTSKLLLQAADECDRFYNGMMNWKASAQAKDRHIAAQAPAGRDAQQWISISERLPDDDCRVLAATWFTMTHDQHMDIVSFRRGSGQFSHSDVTHWMHLPAAPHAAEQASGGA